MAEADGQAVRGTWVQPQRFKSLVGRNHAEFSSARQQVLFQTPNLCCKLSLCQDVPAMVKWGSPVRQGSCQLHAASCTC